MVGFGKTIQYYTWGAVSDDAIARVTNRNIADFLWDDSLGAGLRQALFDAVGKANGIPVHWLLGQKVRDRGFIGWWAIDMPGSDWVLECKDAVAAGFTAFKIRARPWFDLQDRCENSYRLSRHTCPSISISTTLSWIRRTPPVTSSRSKNTRR